jgi:hypothetical protein
MRSKTAYKMNKRLLADQFKNFLFAIARALAVMKARCGGGICRSKIMKNGMYKVFNRIPSVQVSDTTMLNKD